MSIISSDIETAIADIVRGKERITVLTGAGISAESGIPTFRGKDGYWRVGSTEYTPQEIATYWMFSRMPDEVWKWHLLLRGRCINAEPNAGHLALVEMEQLFGDRFTLITQNIDGLHLQAGNSPERTYQIHGNINYMRSIDSDSLAVYPIPKSMPAKARDEDVTEDEWALLRCPDGSPARPHVLWFDEMYNEEHYRFHSSMSVAEETELLIVVGTSGATNLPNHVVSTVLQRGGMIIDVNIEASHFSLMAMSSHRGCYLEQPSGIVLPELVKLFKQMRLSSTN